MEAELGTLELSGDENKSVRDDESLRDFETTEREMLQDDTPKKFPGKNLFAPEFVPEKTDSLSHQGRKELSSEMEDRYRNRSSSGDSNDSLRRNRLRDFDYSARREERDYDAARRGGHAHFAYASHRNIPKLKLREFNGDPLEWPEWSGMFLATIDSSPLTNDEKMSFEKPCHWQSKTCNNGSRILRCYVQSSVANTAEEVRTVASHRVIAIVQDTRVCPDTIQ